ncbi:hypothetical protein Tco_0858663 [Tanacetum coccineum]|uniref:Uncharacterized protein n=1 Tax=Tanacetum coccineum TaxID=301880 RepID=A0ABQ5BAH2_9ASTR
MTVTMEILPESRSISFAVACFEAFDKGTSKYSESNASTLEDLVLELEILSRRIIRQCCNLIPTRVVRYKELAELIQPLEDPKRVSQLHRKLLKTTGLDCSSSLCGNLKSP